MIVFPVALGARAYDVVIEPGLLAQAAGLTAPYWVGFVFALAVTAATWHVFSRASMAQAHAPSAGRA